MSKTNHEILTELKELEPIFHRPEWGTTREIFEAMTAQEFWEVGASGKCYFRADVIDMVAQRYQDKNYIANDIWETKDFDCMKLANNCYLITYVLSQGKEKRLTRRATIWKYESHWQALYHQGTLL